MINLSNDCFLGNQIHRFLLLKMLNISFSHLPEGGRANFLSPKLS